MSNVQTDTEGNALYQQTQDVECYAHEYAEMKETLTR